MILEQLALVPLYNLIYDRGDILNLQPVADYALSRYPGRVSFYATALRMRVEKKERERFLRFLRDHSLRQFLVYDDGRKGDPCRIPASSTPDGATGATPSCDSSSGTGELNLRPDTTTEVNITNVIAAAPQRR